VTAANEYFLEIEAHFALRRATPFILNAKDWALMKKWSEDGVPLPVVIEAIDQVFEKNEISGRRKVISSLSYCRHAVKELWEERKELLIGANEGSPEAGADEALEALAAAVERVSNEIAAKIRALAAKRSVPVIEEGLIELETELIAHLMATIPAAELEAIRAAVAKSLGDTSRLNEKTRARTEEANMRRLIRERFELPRLTLFR
jgi:hypothetical protein